MASRRRTTSPGALRVLVVDDHASFRAAARELLEIRGYDVVGEAGCAASALHAAEQLVPDAVLLDVRLGDESGYDVARALAGLEPAPAVLLVSILAHGDELALAQANGASGFVIKGHLAVTDLGRYWRRPVPSG